MDLYFNDQSNQFNKEEYSRIKQEDFIDKMKNKIYLKKEKTFNKL